MKAKNLEIVNGIFSKVVEEYTSSQIVEVVSRTARACDLDNSELQAVGKLTLVVSNLKDPDFLYWCQEFITRLFSDSLDAAFYVEILSRIVSEADTEEEQKLLLLLIEKFAAISIVLEEEEKEELAEFREERKTV